MTLQDAIAQVRSTVDQVLSIPPADPGSDHPRKTPPGVGELLKQRARADTVLNDVNMEPHLKLSILRNLLRKAVAHVKEQPTDWSSDDPSRANAMQQAEAILAATEALDQKP